MTDTAKVIELLLKAKNVLTGMPGALNGNKLLYTATQRREMMLLDEHLEEALLQLGYDPEDESVAHTQT